MASSTGTDEEFIEWEDERYSTNIERFDSQHQHLFEVLNELYVAMDEGQSEEEVGDILVELERYTEYHFGDEEEFMQDCGYSMDCSECFFNHREQHEEFAQKVRELREKHENGEYITMEVLMFVRDWLDSHIAGGDQDQNYGEYYQENLEGEYEYEPGKLRGDREMEEAHPEASEEETTTDFSVSLGSRIYSGDTLSVPDGPMAAWFERTVTQHGDRVAARFPKSRDRDERTVEQLHDRAREVAAGLLEYGLEPGDRVGIYADPSYEWSVVDLACHLAGLVSVPLSTLYEDERALHIVDDADVDVLVAEATLPVVIEQEVETALRIDKLPTGTPSEDLPGFDRDGDDVATIVYKLGTDKHPRGCALTNRNLLAAVGALEEQLPIDSGGTGTCFLPLAHIYQRAATYYLWHTGNAVAYMDTDEFKSQLRRVRPDVLVGVPQVYERLHGQILERMEELGGAKKFIASDVAQAYGEKMRDGRSASSGLSIKHRMAERTVFSSLRREFGLDDLEYALTGTDSIDSDALHFFWGLGVPMRELYESTELTGLATITGPSDYRADSVGAPFPGTDLALAEDDEVIVRGPTVMDGYWDDEEATAYAIRDDWYHTGDIGAFNDDGTLRIVDSK